MRVPANGTIRPSPFTACRLLPASLRGRLPLRFSVWRVEQGAQRREERFGVGLP